MSLQRSIKCKNLKDSNISKRLVFPHQQNPSQKPESHVYEFTERILICSRMNSAMIKDPTQFQQIINERKGILFCYIYLQDYIVFNIIYLISNQFVVKNNDIYLKYFLYIY